MRIQKDEDDRKIGKRGLIPMARYFNNILKVRKKNYLKRFELSAF